MALSNDLLSQFAKVVTQEKKTSTETIVNGKVIEFTGENGGKYVQLDGSSQLVPLGDTSVDVEDGNRVTVLIKDHTATVTGNISTPAASTIAVQKTETVLAEKIQAVNASIVDLEVNKLAAANAKIEQLEANDVEITGTLTAVKADVDELVADKIDVEILDAKYATIENLNATTAKVGTLEAAHAEFKEATIEDLQVQNGEITNLKAKDAEIENLVAEKADIKVLEAQLAEIDNLKAKDAEIEQLVAEKADIKDLDAKYATIDFANIGEAAIDKFYAVSGIIDKVTISEGVVVKELVGVTISGDLIKANTIMAEQLVVRGSDGNLYKLSTDFSTLEGVTPVEEDSIHGSNIIANSITAEQISVDDLVAFDATIGGFHITRPTEDKAGALYSGVKNAADNTAIGIYMDSEGQLAVGDEDEYLKFFKDSDGTYKLDISAGSIRLKSSNKTVEETIESELTMKADKITQTVSRTYATKQDVEDLEIGGRNYLSDSNDEQFVDAESRAEFLKTTFDLAPFFDENGLIEVTLSFDAYAPVAGMLQVYCQNGSGSRYSFTETVEVTTEWKRYAITFTPTGPNEDFTESFLAFYGTYDTGVVPHVRKLKLEIGNKATDWTPAPEDVANDINEVDAVARDVNTRLTQAESTIKILADAIANMVRKNGDSSVMIQEEDSATWYFDVGNIEKNNADNADAIDTLQTETGEQKSELEKLKEQVAGYEERFTVSVYEGEPCIILHEKTDSDRVQIITNTRRIFARKVEIANTETGEVDVNYTDLVISDYETLRSKKVETDESVKIGGWVWNRRTNGNLGLMWTEVDS